MGVLKLRQDWESAETYRNICDMLGVVASGSQKKEAANYGWSRGRERYRGGGGTEEKIIEYHTSTSNYLHFSHL